MLPITVKPRYNKLRYTIIPVITIVSINLSLFNFTLVVHCFWNPDITKFGYNKTFFCPTEFRYNEFQLYKVMYVYLKPLFLYYAPGKKSLQASQNFLLELLDFPQFSHNILCISF